MQSSGVPNLSHVHTIRVIAIPPTVSDCCILRALVERVLSKRFLSGRKGTADTMMQLNAVLARELAGSLERNANLATSVFSRHFILLPN